MTFEEDPADRPNESSHRSACVSRCIALNQHTPPGPPTSAEHNP